MKRLFILVKKDLLVSYPYLLHPGVALRDKHLRKKMLLLFMGLGILSFYLFLFMKPVFALYERFKLLGMPLGFLALGFLAFLSLLVLLSFPYILSSIYFSEDVQKMLSLPLSAEEIYQSKLVFLSLNSLFYGLLTTLPIIIKYGISEGMGPLYYFYGLTGMVLLSLGTMSLLATALIFLMRGALRLPRIKNILQFLGMLLIMGFSLGVNYFVQSKTGGNPEDVLAEMAQETAVLLDRLLPGLPPLRWLLMAMEKSRSVEGAMYFGLLALLSLGLVALLSRLGAPSMVKGVLSSGTVRERKQRQAGKNRSHPVAVHLFKKEFNELLRTPLYAFNTLGSGLILPLALLMPLFAQKTLTLAEIKKMRPMLELLPLTPVERGAISLGLGIILGIFVGSMGNPLSSSFSREGKNIWLMKSLPISVKDQIIGRMGVGLSFQFLLLLPSLAIATAILFPPLEMILAFSAGNLLAGIFVGLLGLSIDLMRPKLVWDNPQEAMKQNLNLLLTMLVCWGYLGIAGFILYHWKINPAEHIGRILLFTLLSLGMLDGALFIYLSKTMEKALLNMGN